MAEVDLSVNELTITRVFDAPRELVWEAWTDPDLVKRWWGPKGFTCPFAKIDLRVGGEYLSSMRSPEGKDYWSKGVFREIVEPERLVMTDSFADEEGNIVPSTYYGLSSEFPMEMTISVHLEEHEDGTKLTLRHCCLDGVDIKDREDMCQGWNESLDKLAEVLEDLKD